MGFTNVRITEDLVTKYGPTKLCLGCRHALGQITYLQGHNDQCRKRFLEMADEAENKELRERLNKAFESHTQVS